MIKHRMLWWLLMFLLLVSLVWLASNNEGYVLIVRTPYRIQISFNFFLLVFVLSFLGLHYCLRFVSFLRWLPLKRRSKKETLRLKAGNAVLLEGMHALAEGDFEKAEASAQLAQELIQNSDLEKLTQALAAAKNQDMKLSIRFIRCRFFTQLFNGCANWHTDLQSFFRAQQSRRLFKPEAHDIGQRALAEGGGEQPTEMRRTETAHRRQGRDVDLVPVMGAEIAEGGSEAAAASGAVVGAEDPEGLLNSWAGNIGKLLDLVDKASQQIQKECMTHKVTLAPAACATCPR